MVRFHSGCRAETEAEQSGNEVEKSGNEAETEAEIKAETGRQILKTQSVLLLPKKDSFMTFVHLAGLSSPSQPEFLVKRKSPLPLKVKGISARSRMLHQDLSVLRCYLNHIEDMIKEHDRPTAYY